jgi:CBS domain-containing protein
MRTIDPIRSILRTKSQNLYWLPPDATVYQAIELMSEKSAGALPVMIEGRLTGIVSERDYARKVILKGKLSKETLVSEIMSAPAITVSPDETVDECMRIMTGHRIRHLPVVEDGKVVGIVSIGDLVKWIVTAQQETIQHLHSFIQGAYPG